ncbi:NAD(P)-binding protein [Auriculariales sp. MPI-PUGE-AT-0066]|nr:NAD(P)-binding protein [Auriculariales sp. MPI-PUGE-AT-0066]
MPAYDPARDIPSLVGKVALVTGANRGIGFETVLQLARYGATVYIGARTLDSARLAARLVEEQVPDALGRLHALEVNLSDLKSARDAANRFLAAQKNLHILILNAGIMPHPFKKTADGIEDTFAINHLAHFALLTPLLPTLEETAKNSPDVRVVILGSEAYLAAPSGGKMLTVDEINNPLGPGDTVVARCRRYGRSKLASMLIANALGRRFQSHNSTALAVSLNPGTVFTDGVRGWMIPSLPVLNRLVSSTLNASLPKANRGAYNTLFAATSPIVREQVAKFGGQYIMPVGKLQRVWFDGKNEKLADKLWEASEKIVDEVLAREGTPA